MTELRSADAVSKALESGAFDERLSALYGVTGTALLPYRARIRRALERFAELYGDRPLCVFSVSGRTELGGNHTDHQHGRVLTSGISLDLIAVAAPTDDGLLRVHSEGFSADTVRAGEWDAVPAETGCSVSLLRGVAARFAQCGRPAGGFCCFTVSDVPQGSGMSSSAAYEVMLAKIMNDFYADGAFSLTELAQIAQYAENVYFGKPCGLMDQMACALGTVAAIDFADPSAPQTETVTLDLAAEGYVFCTVDSGADHADLTAEYAAVPAEMRQVARLCGGEYLADVQKENVLAQLPSLRAACGDRPVLRALHFFADSARVTAQTAALREHRFADFLRLVRESGRSSELLLQNISPTGSVRQQAVTVVLALCAELLGADGAYRMQGGGFAGSVQVYVPADRSERFCADMNRLLGADACQVLHLRRCPACALWETLPKEDTVCCCKS